MYIKEITLKNFRNYRNLSLEFFSDVNLITGQNAVGKTNIIEAVSIISNIKSFRNVSDIEIIKWEEDDYFCSAVLCDNNDTKFEIGCLKAGDKIKKKAQIDGVEIKRAADYFGRFLTIVFSPDDIGIINGTPDIRRRFFDGVISKTDSVYMAGLIDYKKILALRNKLLKDLKVKDIFASKELDVWDEMLAERAAVLLTKRYDFLARFCGVFKNAVLNMSDKRDAVDIKYISNMNIPQGGLSKESIFNILNRNRKKDIIKGTTTAGPHVDDFVFMDEKGIIYRNCASQGQKRTAVISLKLAENAYIEEITKQKPVILIDDIFSELDDVRRENIVNMTGKENQVIITAVHPDVLKNQKNHKIKKFVVESGGVVSE